MWKTSPDLDPSVLAWQPVTVAGDKLTERVALAVRNDLVHVAVLDKFGVPSTIALRPADARRLGTALIEGGALAARELPS